MAMEQEYRGHTIRFDERKEVWTVRVSVPQDDGFTDITDASLATVKKFIDKTLKKGFARVQVFSEKPYNYTRDEDKRPKFISAVITSISPDGEMFIVYEGEKKAHKERGYVFTNTAANKKLVGEINSLDKERLGLEKIIEKKEEQLIKLDTNKMRDEFLANE